MKKISNKKSGKGQKVNKNKNLEQDAKVVFEKGEVFAESIIGQLALIATNPIGMGAATLGLAIAYAALKGVAERFGVDVDSQFEKEVSHYESAFNDMLDLEEMKKKHGDDPRLTYG